jgi:hypothetical protein
VSKFRGYGLEPCFDFPTRWPSSRHRASNAQSTRVAAASTRCTPPSAACLLLLPARLPPPRGPLDHRTPHLPLHQRKQPPPEALTGVVLRSTYCRHGAALVLSPSPSFASNGFTHRRTRSRAAFPDCPCRRFTGLMAAPPSSCHGAAPLFPLLVVCQPWSSRRM